MRCACLLACLVGLAHAQTGVNDDRVSLPEGPGSLEGLGDNAAFSGNQGAMTYSIEIFAPPGFDGATPSFALNYNSMGGNGVAGMGFDLALPTVERMSVHGLPTYTDADRFVVDGAELVRVDDGEPAVYRARFEQAFARYFWHARQRGDGGYWRVERADGTVDWYGATPDGETVANARLQGAEGPFRWHRVERRDRFEHRLTYHYVQVLGRPYLDRAEYIYTAGPAPEASLRFLYEAREDVIADARSGFNELLTQRLIGVEAWSAGVRVREHVFGYEPYAESGGLSRLERAEQFGIDGEPHPARVFFEYSKALGGVCERDCAAPFLVDMGSVGVSPGAGNATLVDLDGDTLPDVVDTAQPGAHRIFLSRLGDDGHRFAPVVRSATGRQAGHELASPYTQVLDANGDGRADLVNVRTGRVLFNTGSGDWAPAEDLGDVDTLPDFGEAFAVGAEELTHVRFFDYDNDRRIDVVRSNELTTEIYANRGAAGFAPADGVEPIGAGFADQRLEFADLNGDGLLDPVILRAGGLRYRVNLGRGRWSNWRDIEALPFNAAELDFVELEDLNGDSLDDIVLVLADEVRYALNRTGDRFAAPASIRGTAEGALPERVDGVTVLFADMNGSGSDDVVWIGADGQVTYLEIFPLRPNLLTRVTDGLGVITEVEYVTAAQARARDAAPWTDGPLFAMAMVAQVTTTDPSTGAAEVRRRRYREGYFDPVEKQFRGFAEVEEVTDGDATHAGARVVQQYDLGQGTPERAGLMLESETWALDGDAPLTRAVSDYAACDLAPGAAEAGAHYVCLVARETEHIEGGPAAERAVVRTEYTRDTLGNVIHEAQLGVVSIGGGACGPCDGTDTGGPCGPDCAGDEAYAWSDFIAPPVDGRWITGLTWRERESARPDGPYSETQTFYDGDAFVGLPRGEATLGLVSRTVVRVDADTLQPATRQGFDGHGNVVRSLPADADGPAGFEARTTYDPTGLDIVVEEREVSGHAGPPRILRRELGYDAALGQVIRSTNWYVVGGDAPIHHAQYLYDGLGRLTALVLPGDAVDRPTKQWLYDFDGPFPRVVQRERSVRNARLPDRESVQCFDRSGRRLQTRTRIAADLWQVSGFKRYDRRGRIAETFLGYESARGDCEARPPGDTPGVRDMYDALGRAVRTIEPFDGGPPTVRSRVYRPLRTISADGEDTDPASPFADTPVEQREDGLGRVVASVLHTADGALITRLGYDARGELARLIDPEGNPRTQVVDALGRVTRVDGPDRGALHITYDPAGRPIRTEDATGRIVREAYDSLGRRVALWDPDDVEATRAEFIYDDAADCPDGVCTHPAEALVGVRYQVLGLPIEEWFGYDERRRLRRTRYVLDGVALDFTAEYDNLGDVLAEHYPGDLSLRFEYDGGGRLQAIPGVIDRIDYTPQSDVGRRRFANGVDEVHGFDGLGRVVSRRVVGPDAAPLIDLGYTRNRVGHLTAIIDATPPRAGPGWGARFEYDALYRLTAAHLDPERPDHAETIRYAYGPTGRLIEKASSRGAASPLHVGALSYDPARPNAVTRAGDLAYGYDRAGRLTTRGDVRFLRDFRGRIGEAWRGEAAIARFGYSPTGRRILRVEGARRSWHLADTLEIEDGSLLVHARLDEQRVATFETDAISARVLADADDDDRITAADALLGAGDDAELRALLRASARRASLEGQARQTFLHYDHMRSVLLLTAADGAVIERRSHAPYGQARHVDSGVETTVSFSGQHTDRSTGLTFIGARYHDGHVGRWAAPDPGFRFLDADQLDDVLEVIDPYGFNRGNPINFTDLDGRKAKVFAAAAGAILGVLSAGTANVAAAVIGGASGFAGAVAVEVIRYKKAGIKLTWRNAATSLFRIASRTLNATLASGALGLPWAGAEILKAVTRTGIAYGAAKTYDNGKATGQTTIWDTMTFLVDQVSLGAGVGRAVGAVVQVAGIALRHYRGRRVGRAARTRRAFGRKGMVPYKPGRRGIPRYRDSTTTSISIPAEPPATLQKSSSKHGRSMKLSRRGSRSLTRSRSRSVSRSASQSSLDAPAVVGGSN